MGAEVGEPGSEGESTGAFGVAAGVGASVATSAAVFVSDVGTVVGVSLVHATRTMTISPTRASGAIYVGRLICIQTIIHERRMLMIRVCPVSASIRVRSHILTLSGTSSARIRDFNRVQAVILRRPKVRQQVFRQPGVRPSSLA